MNLNGQNSEIVETYNLCINDQNISHYNDFKITFKTPELNNWGKVSSSNLGEHMIAKFNLEVFDYSLFDLFNRYKEFIPANQQEFYETNFLFKQGKIEPEIAFDFFKYLYEYSKMGFVGDKYYYTIYNLSNVYNSGSTVRILINNKNFKFSTIHSTYKNEIEHLNQYEKTDESVSNGKTEWINIEKNEIIIGDTEKLLIQKIYYREKIDELFINLFKMFELAKTLDIKIERNAEW
jgi:hypothetical protein